MISAVHVKNMHLPYLHSVASTRFRWAICWRTKTNYSPASPWKVLSKYATKLIVAYITQSDFPISRAILKGDRSGIIVGL